jgi:hypothetical protein
MGDESMKFAQARAGGKKHFDSDILIRDWNVLLDTLIIEEQEMSGIFARFSGAIEFRKQPSQRTNLFEAP